MRYEIANVACNCESSATLQKQCERKLRMRYHEIANAVRKCEGMECCVNL